MITRRRPRTCAVQIRRRPEPADGGPGRPRRADEATREFAAALDAGAGDASETWSAIAAVVEATAYGGRVLAPEEERRLLRAARDRPRTRLHVNGGRPGPSGPRSSQALARASASSQEAPDSSSGR